MTPKLRSMLTGAAVVVLSGVGFLLYTPQPATRSMLELRDAGIADGQKFVLTCPERLTARTRRRINAAQPGLLRPKQSYGRVARTAVCFNPDAGNCFRPADGLLRVGDLEGEVIVPSLRRDTDGADLADDGGEDAIDDAFQYRLDDCIATTCPNFDAGDGSNFCGRLNRLMLVSSPCMIPNCWLPDGGWDDETPVDCKFGGPYSSGGPARWRGCNVGAAEYASGTQCLPVECSVVAGDVPQEWL